MRKIMIFDPLGLSRSRFHPRPEAKIKVLQVRARTLKSMKINLKMDPKTIPNLQKLSLKSIPKTGAEKTPQKRANVTKSLHFGVHFWSHLDKYFRTRTVFLGTRSAAPPLGHPKPILGASWDHLGAILGSFWVILGSTGFILAPF